MKMKKKYSHTRIRARHIEYAARGKDRGERNLYNGKKHTEKKKSEQGGLS